MPAIRGTVRHTKLCGMTTNRMAKAIFLQRGVRVPVREDPDIAIRDVQAKVVQLKLTGQPLWRTYIKHCADKARKHLQEEQELNRRRNGRKRLSKKSKADDSNDPTLSLG